MSNVEYGDRQVAMDGEILRTVVGSGVHGIAVEGTDDHDEMGVYIEPARMVIGTDPAQDNYIWRTQPEGHRSGPGDTDLVMHSLRKYLRLAAQGNPTALLPLWAPQNDVLACTTLGSALRGHRDAFMSKSAVERFLGYMRSQHERMLGHSKRNVPNRPELIEKYGWDVKYGSHALRLAYQGYEIARHGTLTLPMPDGAREHVLSVKRGEVAREDVSDDIRILTADVERLLADDSPLPDQADWQRISEFSERAHLQAWGSTRGV